MTIKNNVDDTFTRIVPLLPLLLIKIGHYSFFFNAKIVDRVEQLLPWSSLMDRWFLDFVPLILLRGRWWYSTEALEYATTDWIFSRDKLYFGFNLHVWKKPAHVYVYAFIFRASAWWLHPRRILLHRASCSWRSCIWYKSWPPTCHKSWYRLEY